CRDQQRSEILVIDCLLDGEAYGGLFLFARAAGGIETTEPLHVSGQGFDKNRRERFLDVREQSKACSRTAQRVAAKDGLATHPSGRALPTAGGPFLFHRRVRRDQNPRTARDAAVGGSTKTVGNSFRTS